MSIIRVEKRGNYVAVANEPLNDSRLSWEARGVLAYLYTKPDGWQMRTNDLWHQSPGGRDKCKRIVAELQEAGYINRHRLQDPKTQRFYWVSTVYESVSLNPEKAIDWKPGDGKPGDGLPGDGKPGDVVSTDLVSTEKAKTEKESSSSKQREELPAAAAKNELQDILLIGGITGKKQKELCELEHVTPEYAAAHIDQAEADGISTGLLITRMLDGDPAPSKKRSNENVTQKIPVWAEAIVKR